MTETFESYRKMMFSIAYRMLGTVMEAEDVVQQAYLQYQSVPTQEIRSLKSYLDVIVTRLCLNHIRLASHQRESYVGPWLPEPLPSADTDTLLSPPEKTLLNESISVAFLVLLQTLSPEQRTVFILREVFDYQYAEIAEILGKDTVACRQLLSRARKHITDNRPRFESSPETHHRLFGSFIKACETGELSDFMNILTDDAIFVSDGGGNVSGAATLSLHGRETVARFLLGTVKHAPNGYRIWIGEINRHPALIVRLDQRAITIMTIEIKDGYIHKIYAIANPDKLKAI
jgi:RNA polymerase sigma-70 factor, ECF subfamily